MKIITLVIIASLASLILSGCAPTAPTSAAPTTVSAKYPILTTGALAHARLADLPEGVLLRCGGLTITESDIAKEIANASEYPQEQLRANSFFLLEQVAAQRLLLMDAKAAIAKSGKDVSAMSDPEILQAYFQERTAGAKVTDQEIADFYENNRDLIRNATLEQAKPQITSVLLRHKQEDMVDQSTATLGKRITIEVAAAWVERQVGPATDNPVDKSRKSGKATLVGYGSAGCCGPDRMTPLLDALQQKHGPNTNILFVNVGEYPILANRYGIHEVPTLVLFGKDGLEVFRHAGLIARGTIEKKLDELSVK